MVRRSTDSARPLAADWIAAIPTDSSVADRIEDTHPCGRGVRHLDHRSRVALIAEIDKTAARTIALLADRVAGRQGALVDLVIVLWPARPMLHALMPSGEEVAIHAGRIAALLDQLKLHIARVGQGDGDVRVVVATADVSVAGDRPGGRRRTRVRCRRPRPNGASPLRYRGRRSPPGACSRTIGSLRSLPFPVPRPVQMHFAITSAANRSRRSRVP